MALGAAVVDQKAEPQNERLGGARADFVANLGRRVAELCTTLKHLTPEPDSTRLRDELRRRVHALAAGARLLRFGRLAEELAACEELLEQVAERGRFTDGDASVLRSMFERMPALAWGLPVETVSSPPPPPISDPAVSTTFGPPMSERARIPSPVPPADAEAPGASWPQTALVVGPAALADALTNDIAEPSGPSIEHEASAYEVERTEDVATAIDLARAVAPDVMVVDTDAEGSRKLVEALLADPLTEPVPIIAVGRWSRPDEAAPFVALGVARALPKPVSPLVLRRACAEATSTYVRREFVREPLGAMTLDQLGSRLAEELRRGLCDAVDAKGRGARVDLGEGSEVLAALWGAVARIRDLVTIQSKGGVRFAPVGPEGALPVAAWIGTQDGLPASQRASSEGRLGASTALDGLGILVADDDPAVTWFLAGVLRAAGATVHEAHDGARALEVAYRVTPDLVISDVVMPGLDGFALCRALKRDLVLRDVPVILLSWKEDLLQRVRELGADADGYLRKEASAPAIVQRVREVLRPRRRVADRLAAGGEVRGRLDGLTTRTLLGLACTHRPWSTVTVRDASFLYEVEISGGRPARATRTATDGTFQRGPGVLAALLGVGAGRFVVTPAPTEPTARSSRTDLEGRLSEQLYPPIAAARAAQRLLSGAHLVQIERVRVAEDRIAAYVEATPEPARSLLRSLGAGASPRALITSGQAPARLVEDVLCDAAAHGAIGGITGPNGVDLLTPAIEREMGVLSGIRLSLPPPPLHDPLAEINQLPRAVTPAPLESYATAPDETPSPYQDLEPSVSESVPMTSRGLGPMTPEGGYGPPEVEPEEADDHRNSIPPGMEDEDGLWPFRRSLVGLEPPSFTPRPTTPLPSPAVEDAFDVKVGTEASLVEANVASKEPLTPPPIGDDESFPIGPMTASTHGDADPSPSPRRAASDLQIATLGSLSPPPASGDSGTGAVSAADRSDAPRSAPRKARPSNTVARDDSRATESERPVPRPSSYAPAPGARAGSEGRSKSVWVAFALVSCAFALVMRFSRRPEPAAPPAAPAPPASAAEAHPTPSAEAAPQENPATEGVAAQELALRPEDKVAAGQGMLEVVAGASDSIYVDGRLLGPGPVQKIALASRSKEYEVRVKLRGEDRIRYVVVKEGRLMRVRVAPPWSR